MNFSPQPKRGDFVQAFSVANMTAVVVLQDPTKQAIDGAPGGHATNIPPLYPGAFLGHRATSVSRRCAGTMAILVPTLVNFLTFRRRIVSPLLLCPVKGRTPGK